MFSYKIGYECASKASPAQAVLESRHRALVGEQPRVAHSHQDLLDLAEEIDALNGTTRRRLTDSDPFGIFEPRARSKSSSKNEKSDTKCSRRKSSKAKSGNPSKKSKSRSSKSKSDTTCSTYEDPCESPTIAGTKVTQAALLRMGDREAWDILQELNEMALSEVIPLFNKERRNMFLNKIMTIDAEVARVLSFMNSKSKQNTKKVAEFLNTLAVPKLVLILTKMMRTDYEFPHLNDIKRRLGDKATAVRRFLNVNQGKELLEGNDAPSEAGGRLEHPERLFKCIEEKLNTLTDEQLGEQLCVLSNEQIDGFHRQMKNDLRVLSESSEYQISDKTYNRVEAALQIAIDLNHGHSEVRRTYLNHENCRKIDHDMDRMVELFCQ